MSPPVRKGDGTGVVPQDVAELRTGDGRVLFGGAIPDTGLLHYYHGPAISSVSTWPDNGDGNANDASASGDPQLVSSGINGYQSVDYDGTGDYHAGSAPSTGFGSNGEYTLVAVVQANSSSGYEVLVTAGADTDGARIDKANGSWRIGHVGVGVVSGGSPTTDPTILVATYDGSNAILDVNKTETINTSLSAPSGNPSGPISIGSRIDSGDFEGKIVAAGYDPVYSDATRRDALTDLFASEYDITL